MSRQSKNEEARNDARRIELARRTAAKPKAPGMPDLEYRYMTLLQALDDLPQAASPARWGGDGLPTELQGTLERIRSLRRKTERESAN